MRNINSVVLFCFAIIVICSCSKKQELPKGVLSVDEMAMILVDIYTAESKISALKLKKDSSEILFRHYELKVFEDHGVNDTIYRESYKYYLSNPHLLDKAYDIVIDSLGVRERLLNKKEEKTSE